MPSIDSATLRIINTKGNTIGTGFLVSDILAVTCAHLVTSIGLDGENRIRVQFTGQKQPIHARVLDQYLDFDRDMALLELESVPEGIQPLGLAAAANCRPGSEFRSFGYASAAEVQGIHANGKIDGYLPEHQLLQLQSPQANHGISGAPVLDESRGVVVGMITRGHTELGRNAETTFATPCELLFEICPEIHPSETCPYLGLETFTAKTAQFFFGREALTGKLLATLRGGCRFLAVFGPSGSGKSSLVRAGLLPTLESGLFADWKQVSMRPADDPFAQMQAAGLESLDSLTGRALLFIDQFEELFTLCPDEFREKFIEELAAALENSRFMLVLSMRDDFYSTFNAKAALLAQSDQLKIENVPVSLKRAELLAMIERPAKALGLALEEGLTELILKDLARDGEARSSTLPLLEFTLTQLWDNRREGLLLTHAAYQAIGGVTGSLARWADETYSDLPKAGQTLAESLLTSLVHLGDEAQGLPDTRRRRALAEFDQPTRHVIQRFVARRLLVTGAETVELVHDALVREWGRLVDWVRINRTQLRMLEAVSEAAEAWSAAPTNPDLLVHRGGRLEDALKLRNILNTQEQSYLDVCVENREREIKSRDALRRRITTGLFTGLVIALVLAGFAIYQMLQAQTQARIARAGELASQAVIVRNKNFPLSLLLGMEAFQSQDIPQSRGALLDNTQTNSQLRKFLYGHTSGLSSVAFSPDGKTLASGSEDKTIILWDVATGKPIGKPLTGHLNGITSVAFSPNGKMLASGSKDKTIILWDMATGQPIGQPLTGHLDGVTSVIFSPDGKILESGSSDQTVMLWDVATHQPIDQPLTGHSASVRSVGFSSDGQTLASGSDDSSIILWNASTHKPILPPLNGHTASVLGIAFSPDGKMLASGSADGTIILWNVANGEPIDQLLRENPPL